LKNYIIIFISTILLISSFIGLSGCTSKNTSDILDKNNVLENDYKTDDKTDNNKELESKYKIYESKQFGYSLQFPMSWNNNYIVNESNDYIEVSFIGKSETSKNYNENLSKANGLALFYIANEDFIKDQELVDSAQEIGKVNGISYYYFTSTDYPLGALINENIEDENEKKLAMNDFLIATEMSKDIENIIKTFKSLE